MRRLIRNVLVLGAVALVSAAAAVSYSGPSPSDARKHAVESRADAFNRAARLYPDPKTSNFPLRKALVEMTKRQDMEHHPWYIYILGDNGNAIGYYVGKTVPENACNFLSSTEDVYGNDQSVVKMQSPSYDGVYYGNAACDAWFFFDAATNALIQIRGVHFFSSDQPLRIDAKPIRVETTK